MGQDQLDDLLRKYLKGTISRNELHKLLDLIAEKTVDEVELSIDELVDANFEPDKPNEHFEQSAVLRNIRHRISDSRTHRSMGIRWLSTGIAALMVIGFVWVRYYRSIQAPPEPIAIASDIILPEQNHVILYVSDGTSYDLMQSDPDTLRKVGIEVQSSPDGETLIAIDQGGARNPSSYTLKNGKGHTCQVQLPDGSHIWLNAGAALSYSFPFETLQRNVSLDGEAFFEVAANPHTPFRVSTAHMAIRVLGTQFNVSSDRMTGVTRTTLVKGAVEVSHEDQALVLKPGWQASSGRTVNGILNDTINVRDVIAWKDGYFRFNDHTIDDVMEQVAMWYSIEHVYIEERTSDRFTGSISKTQRLSDVLSQLAEISNYKFNIKERSVSVMK